MIGRTDLVRWLGVATVIACSAGCGDDQGELEIENAHGEGPKGEITQVLIRECRQRYWHAEDAPLDPAQDLPPGGSDVRIPFGESVTFRLAAGCHDVSVTRDGKTARARVVLDAGESATWIPFSIEENESWWCYSDDCE